MTTPVEYEVANLTKCLKADFRHVAAISRNRKKLARIQQLLSETASPEQIARVGFYLPEEFISKLYDWAMEDPAGAALEKGKPRKRTIAFNTAQLTEGERRQREEAMLKKSGRCDEADSLIQSQHDICMRRISKSFSL